MIFHTPQKKFNMPTIKINNTELGPATHFNYLGITINKHTKWDGDVKKIAIKISKANGLIFKIAVIELGLHELIWQIFRFHETMTWGMITYHRGATQLEQRRRRTRTCFGRRLRSHVDASDHRR